MDHNTGSYANNEDIRGSVNVRIKVFFIVLLLIVAIIVAQLFSMQVISYGYYQGKVINNIQQETVVNAVRGLIYDRNMTVLAGNTTAYRVFISPVDIQANDNEAHDHAKQIATALSSILGVSYDDVYQRSQKPNRKDETIKNKVDKETADKVRAFIDENGFSSQIYLQASNVRYYPGGSLAANVVGAMGTDTGLFGLELQYNKELSGTNGKYITTKNGQSQDLPSTYDYYVAAKDGLNLVTTIDATLQRMLEAQLYNAYVNADARNKVAGVVIDVNTGEILAMGQYPTVDLNSPYVLTAEAQVKYDAYLASGEVERALAAKGLMAGTEAYDKEYAAMTNNYRYELIYNSWNNKVVSETYEPGSTFKILTTAMALEEQVTTFADTYSCPGYYVVADTRISCHKKTGHGTHDFATMLQQSCNPTLMQVALKIGQEKFYEYFQFLGYMEKTGIDLPGEASGIYSSKNAFGIVSLACYSFGQTFKTTMIQHISAVAAIANGGHLITPHMVNALTDANGNVVVSYETETKRQVISEEVCREILDVLEKGVSGDGGAKNAYVAGYKIAAKTGTSEKRDKVNPLTGQKDLRIGSTVAIAPSDAPQIAVLIIVDEPVGVVYGSTVAAPFIANFLAEALPYIGVERNYTEEEMKRALVSVKNYVGNNVDEALLAIRQLGLSCDIVGNGETVTAQMPAAGAQLTKSDGRVILYTENISPSTRTTIVPDVMGMVAEEAIKALQAKGLNVLISGASNYQVGTGAVVVSQSIEKNMEVKYGTVVTIRCLYTDPDDIELPDGIEPDN